MWFQSAAAEAGLVKTAQLWTQHFCLGAFRVVDPNQNITTPGSVSVFSQSYRAAPRRGRTPPSGSTMESRTLGGRGGGWKKSLACSFTLVSQNPSLVYGNFVLHQLAADAFLLEEKLPHFMEQQKILQNFGEEKKI